MTETISPTMCGGTMSNRYDHTIAIVYTAAVWHILCCIHFYPVVAGYWGVQ